MIETEQWGSAAPAVEPGSAARDLIGASRALRTAIADAVTAPEKRRLHARRAYESVRDDIVRAELARMPLDRIKEITQGRLRLAAIEQAGFRTVEAVITVGPSPLESIQGIGPQTAAQVVAAARQLQAALERETRVRFDPDDRTMRQAELLAGLYGYAEAKARAVPDPSPLAAELDRLLAVAAPASSRLRMFFAGSRKKQDARDALGRLAAVMRSPAAVDAQTRLFAPGGPRPTQPGCGPTTSPGRSSTTACSSRWPSSRRTPTRARASCRRRSRNGCTSTRSTCRW